MNWSLAPVALVPPGVVTVMSTVPAEPAGAVAVKPGEVKPTSEPVAVAGGDAKRASSNFKTGLENSAKATSLIARLESALTRKENSDAEDLLAELETLIPSDPRMRNLRARVAALPGPKKRVLVELGGGVAIELVLIRPGSFRMGGDAGDVPVQRDQRFASGEYLDVAPHEPDDTDSERLAHSLLGGETRRVAWEGVGEVVTIGALLLAEQARIGLRQALQQTPHAGRLDGVDAEAEEQAAGRDGGEPARHVSRPPHVTPPSRSWPDCAADPH